MLYAGLDLSRRRLDVHILDDQGFQTVVMEHYLKRVYGQARAGSEPDATSPVPSV